MGSKKGTIFICLFGLVVLSFRPGSAQVTEPAADVSDTDIPNIKKLRDKLFNDNKYDKNVRPITHHSNTTVVEMSIMPRYIIDVYEDISLFLLDSWIFLIWNDFRLAWNPDDYDGLRYLRVASHMLWQPDINVYNSHSWNMNIRRSANLVIKHTGLVYYVPPVITTTFCPMDTAAVLYPYDTIECEIQFGSWAHDGWQVDLQVHQDEVYMEDFMNSNPRWNLLVDQVNMIRVVNHYNCCEEPYITLIAKFPMARKYPPELKVIWSPCIVVMALALTTFWMRPDSWKKLVLSPILILILTVLIVYVGRATKSPTSPHRAVSFLSSTMYAVVSAMILEVFVINISNISGPTRPPVMVVNFLSGSVGKRIAFYTNWPDKIAGDKIQLQEDLDRIINQPTIKDEWMLVGAVTDRILFVIFVIVFASIHSL